ncbi:MAG: signal peptidase I [Desulfobacterales bacterium]|nr:signal peptidase I [Desulfobacterales bacterium]
MKPEDMKPSLLVKSQTEKALSGKALAILLAAVLDKGVPFRFTAKGFSMSPFIKDGDIITIQPLSDKEPSVGDVAAIFYTVTEKLVVHRLIGKKGASFIAKGDNNPEMDGVVPQEKILGKVRIIERNGKKILLGLGKERFLIAWLMRRGLFLPLIRKSQKIRSVLDAKTKP